MKTFTETGADVAAGGAVVVGGTTLFIGNSVVLLSTPEVLNGLKSRALYSFGPAGILGAEITRRMVADTSEQRRLGLAYTDISSEMGTSMTINLMRRNAQLRDNGDISQAELIRRNKALGDSARREGERNVKEARWIGDRFSNVGTAIFGSFGDGLDYWTSW